MERQKALSIACLTKRSQERSQENKARKLELDNGQQQSRRERRFELRSFSGNLRRSVDQRAELLLVLNDILWCELRLVHQEIQRRKTACKLSMFLAFSVNIPIGNIRFQSLRLPDLRPV